MTRRIFALLLAFGAILAWFPFSYSGDPGITGLEVRDRERYLHRLKFIRMKRPEDASLSYRIGNLYYSLEMEDDAIKEYRRTLRVQPDHKDAKWFLSKVLFRKGYLEEAFRLTRELLDTDKENPELYEWAGKILLELELPDLAGEYFSRVDLLMFGETQEGKQKRPTGWKFF